MATVSERARELRSRLWKTNCSEYCATCKGTDALIEQALLAERRLAMAFCVEMVSGCLDDSYPYTTEKGAGNKALEYAATKLRAAAEKEVAK